MKFIQVIRNGRYICYLILVIFLITLQINDTHNVYAGNFTEQNALNGANAFNPLGGPSYPLLQDSYFTDDSGNILMIVNVLGEVARPGQFVVRENVDLSTILAVSGGIRPDADLKKVLVARREPDSHGQQAYIIDVKAFYKNGDRSSFIALKPNDTVIIPEKGVSLSKLARIMSIAYPFVTLYDVIDRNK